MRLLITIPYYEPAWGYGGPPRLVSSLARQLAQRHQVTVLTTDAYTATHRLPAGHEVLGGVQVYRFPTVSNTLAWKSKIFWPRGFRAAVAEHVQRSDFVFLSDFRHYLNAVIAPWLWRWHKPYSLAAYGQMQKPPDLKYPLKTLFDMMYGHRLITQASIVFAQTQHEANDYRTLGARPEQIRILPLMEAAPTSAELNQRGAFRAKYNIPATTKVLLFVGRLHHLKGIAILLQSLAQVQQRLRGQDIRLVIVGRDDGYLTAMNRLITELGLEQTVIQTGPLYGLDNAAGYLDADVFVLTPPYYEETSLASVRAISFGLPVITTPQAELPWLDDYEAGSTVAAQPNAIADKLTLLLDDDKLQNQLRGNAIRLFREHYQIDHVITLLEHDLTQFVPSV